jgi:transposase
MVRMRRRSGLGRGIQEELIKYFCMGVTARSAAQIAGVNRNTAILFYHKLREVIFAEVEAATGKASAGAVLPVKWLCSAS